MYKNIYLVVKNKDEIEDYKDIINYIIQKYNITPNILHFNDILQKDIDYSATIFMLYLSDENIKLFFNNNLKFNINIAILPNSTCKYITKLYEISEDIYQAIDDGLNEKLLQKVDILKANDIIVFDRIVIGDMHIINKITDDISFFQKIKLFFHNLKHLSFKSYTLTIEDKIIQIVATGMTILKYPFNKNEKVSSLNNGKLNTFILAPSSLLAYFKYLIFIFIYQKISINNLPNGVGYIRCSQLNIESSDPIEATIDDNLISTQKLEFIVDKEVLNLHINESLIKIEEELTQSNQDIINIKTLPSQKDLQDILLKGKLPFFKRASEDEFKDLFINLRNSAKFSSIFITLMILSTLLATTGLFENSSPVIIGAMILAPLIAPIVSLSMGMIRNDNSLIINSSKTLFYGIVTAIIFSAVFTYLMPLKEITSQMESRLHPNLLDLMVAVFSGIAAAYASSKQEIAQSLAGVAIAVALVPPLSVTGIGIGMLNYEVIYGAFLLFLTNLIGIILSAALTFIVLGYSPIKRATKSIVYTSIMFIIISIPLYFSFIKIVKINNYFNQLKSLKYMEINKNRLELQVLNIKKSNNNNLIININVLSSKIVTDKELHKLQQILSHKLNKNVILKANTEVIIK